MKNKYLLVLFNLSLFLSLTAQVRTENFEIIPSKKKYSNALYNHFKYFDSRKDTSHYGTLLIGRKNILSSVVAKESMNIQFINLMYSAIDASAKSGTLLFQINKMRFSETTKNDNDIATFQLKAKIYSVINKKCFVIHKIDTSIQASFGGDMSYMIMVSASNLIANELAKSLYKVPADTDFIYSYQIERLDSLEKLKIPLYSQKILKDGLYQSYESFKLQLPDKACSVLQKEENSNSVVLINELGKEIKNDTTKIYAIVYKGTGYILINEKYRRLEKEKDEFNFYIDWNEIPENLRTNNENRNLTIPIGIGTGMTGATIPLPIGLIIGALNKNKNSEVRKIGIKIDYKTGGFIYNKTKF
jgi:hypothetical protein